MQRIFSVLVILAFFASTVMAADLHEQAVQDSLTPIRPGVPGTAPFWNGQAKQFMAAPAFEFAAVAGAKSYRFSVRAEDGQTLAFEAEEPWAALTPVWAKVPVGTTTLTVEGLNRSGGGGGEVVGVAGTRTFHRAAIFNGPYGKPVVPYAQSARLAIQSVMGEPFVKSWRDSGKPDASYPLYRYAAKVIGSLVGGCAMYASQLPRPADAEEAIATGKRAADFLIGISQPPGTPLEFFPPTYHGAKPTERENDDWMMLMTPAEAAQGYLDLHDVTKDPKYLDAATRIADTYGKLQLKSGTWPLKVDNRTGQPLADIDLIPSEVIRFLDRLVTQYGQEKRQPTLDRAVGWMMENPVRTFNWQAQFDDAKLRGAYQNLAKHEACEFANYLFAHAAPKDADKAAKIGKIALGEEIVRFAEDQFVVWENPPKLAPRQGIEPLDPRHWITPCSTEQYAMFEPISGSSAFMITSYVAAYRATGKPLYLAKAQSLANALTVAQQRHHGRYPTRMIDQDLAYWLNSTINSARAMKLLGEIE